jgi:hypothetical protein
MYSEDSTSRDTSFRSFEGIAQEPNRVPIRELSVQFDATYRSKKEKLLIKFPDMNPALKWMPCYRLRLYDGATNTSKGTCHVIRVQMGE